MATNLTVDEARGLVLAHLRPSTPRQVPLVDALGLVLAEDVIASDALPRFDNAAMDGYAVRAASIGTATAERPVVLSVVGEVAAGSARECVLPADAAVRIMTGAPIPSGADSVVPFEETDEAERRERDRIGIRLPISAGANVRRRGEDLTPGARALPAGLVLTPAALGQLAALGRATAMVYPRPRVAVLSTGDELVAPGEPLPRGKIYDANGIAILTAVREAGGDPTFLGCVPDRHDALLAALRAAANYDLLITSAGVSRGDYDLVKDVLSSVGRIDFWTVRMKPGRPLAFGWLGDVPMIGLPGNPAAALVGFEQFARPAIRRLLGQTQLERLEATAILHGDATNPNGRRCFLRAHLTRRDGTYHAELMPSRGAAALTSLVLANCLVVIPEDCPAASSGDRVRVQILGDIPGGG